MKEIHPDFAQRLTYFAQYLNVEAPLKNWVLFEVGGLFLGALSAALFSGNFRLHVDRGPGIRTSTRLIAAVSGGIMIGFASRLARGCTSGVALSGGAQLAVGGWIFVIAMFVSGFIAAALVRRLWT
jgi:uncharacterized membrane protein YedE/YeeE